MYGLGLYIETKVRRSAGGQSRVRCASDVITLADSSAANGVPHLCRGVRKDSA